MTLLLALVLQFLPGLPDPDAPVSVGGVIEGPYLFREDEALTTKVVLTNGVTAIVRESNASDLTSLTLESNVGYIDENPGAGEARIVAQMLADGAGRPDPSDIHPLRSIGGAIEVEVRERRTTFQILVPPDHTVDAMEWQAAVLDAPVFQDDVAEHVAGRVRARQARALDRPSERVRERLVRLAYGDHPYGRGSILDADGLSPDTASLSDFFATHYGPDHLTVVLVGPFVREEMLGEIARTFGALLAPEPAADEDSSGDLDTPDTNEESGADGETEDAAEETTPAPEEGGAPQDDTLADIPIEPGFRYDWERGPWSRAHFGLAFRVPEAAVAGTRERYVLETVLAVLADGRASRLNAFVRDEQEAIDRAEISYVDMGTAQDPELLVLLTVTADDIEAAEVAVFTELERIRRFGVNGAEVARARVRAAQRHYERRQTVAGLTQDLALREFQADWKLGERFPAGISEVTPSEVQAFVRESFREDNLSVFEFLPSDSVRALSSEDFIARILSQVPEQMVSRTIEELDVTAQVPIRGAELVMDISNPMNRVGILRGPEVFYVEDHRFPLVSFGIFFPGGRVLETTENTGITELMLQTSLRGTRRFNASEIARRIENAGARVEVVNEPDYFGFVLDGVSGDLGPALEIVMELWQEPSFLEADVEFAKRRQRARIYGDAEQAYPRSAQYLIASVFAGDPYSLPPNGTLDSLERITPEMLEEWHFEHARAVMPVIVVAGDVNGSGIVSTIAETIINEDLFERDVSALPPPPEAGEEPSVPPVPAGEEGDAFSFGVLAYGGTISAFSGPDRAPMAIIGDLLDGTGGRLARAFSLDGLPASAQVEADLRARSGMFQVVVSFVDESEGSGGADRIRAVLEGELRNVMEEALSETALTSAKAHSDLVHRAGLEGTRKWVDAVARSVLSGGGPEGVYGFSDAIDGVDAGQLGSSASRFFRSSNVHVVEIRGR